MGKFGGRQENAGRPKGAKNKKTIELIERVTKEGITPLQLLLNDMRFFHDLAQEQMEKTKNMDAGSAQAKAFRAAIALKDTAREYAKDAAPYLHPKLSSIEANVNVQEHEARLAVFHEEEENDVPS